MSKVVKKEGRIKILYAWLCKNPGTIILFLAVLLIGLSWAVIVLESATNFFNKNIKILEFLGFGLSGLAALYGLVVLNRRAEAQVENNRLTEKNNRLTEKGLSQERFKTAVEHLSSDKMSLRMSSFYELFHLAKDNKEDYGQTITNILCAHLRQITKYDDFDASKNNKNRPKDVHSEEVITLFGILFGEENGEIFDRCYYDLNHVNLAYFKFKLKNRKNKIDFSNANLSWAVFQGGDLRGYDFEKSVLFRAIFIGIDLRKVHFNKTELQSAAFVNTDLSESWFEGEVVFDMSAGKVTPDSSLCHTSFYDTNLEKATFAFINLCYANLEKAKSLETTEALLVIYNSGTTFPKDFDPEIRSNWIRVPPNLPTAGAVSIIEPKTKTNVALKPPLVF